MDANTPEFLESGFIPLLRQLDPAATGRWGKMNAQQMVEHLNDFMLVSVGKLQFPLSIPEEHLPGIVIFYTATKFRRIPRPLPLFWVKNRCQFARPGWPEAIDRLEDTMNVFSAITGRTRLHKTFTRIWTSEFPGMDHTAWKTCPASPPPVWATVIHSGQAPSFQFLSLRNLPYRHCRKFSITAADRPVFHRAYTISLLGPIQGSVVRRQVDWHNKPTRKRVVIFFIPQVDLADIYVLLYCTKFTFV